MRFRTRQLTGRQSTRRFLSLEPLEDRRLLTADFVIQIAFDGLRPDAVTALGADQLPNVYRLIDEGAWTDNARADYSYTETSPNHSNMLTSRPVAGEFGHGVTFNYDNGSTIHTAAGSYVESIFDVVHDQGLRTGLYASKSKFAFYDRSWDGTNGRPDTTGDDNGRDKIDAYYYHSDTSLVTSQFVADMNAQPYNYALISFRDPDSAGHTSGWMSAGYLNAVMSCDARLGEILEMIEDSPVLNGHTNIIFTADHGGDGFGHGTATNAANYTVPLFVWGPDVTAGGDLYALNSATRKDPGTSRPLNSVEQPPIRNGDSANLATQLLGLDVINGSQFNSSHELAVAPTSPWQNPALWEDVNGDLVVTPLDTLIVSNQLNTFGSQLLPLDSPDPQVAAWYLDVSGDKLLTPLDALIVVNYLNSQSAAGAEGEATPPAAVRTGVGDWQAAVPQQRSSRAVRPSFAADDSSAESWDAQSRPWAEELESALDDIAPKLTAIERSLSWTSHA